MRGKLGAREDGRRERGSRRKGEEGNVASNRAGSIEQHRWVDHQTITEASLEECRGIR